MLGKAFNRKQTSQTFPVNNKKSLKKIIDRIRTKSSSQRLLRNRRDTTEPNDNL